MKKDLEALLSETKSMNNNAFNSNIYNNVLYNKHKLLLETHNNNYEKIMNVYMVIKYFILKEKVRMYNIKNGKTS